MTTRSGPGEALQAARTAVDPGIAWRIAVFLLIAKLVQWLILLVFALDRDTAGLPEVSFGSHVLAGCWVGSSLVLVLWRRWIGVVSAALYSGLSLYVSTVLLIQGTDVVWNVVTASGSAGILIALVAAVIHRDFHHSRW